MKYNRKLLTACLFFLPAVVPVNAQQITGTPGSPSALQVSHLSIAFRLVVQQRPESIRQQMSSILEQTVCS